MSQQRIVIAATFASEPIRLSLSSWFKTWSWQHRLEFAPYNQVFQQLLDPASHLGRNALGLNVLLVRFEDWLQSPEDLEIRLSEFIEAVRTYAQQHAMPTLICVCPESPVCEAKLQRRFVLAEERLAEALADLDQLQVVRSREVLASYRVNAYCDVVSNQTAHIPYTQLYFHALAARIARHVHALQRHPYKVIALDCDNSLWEGVCGEDGLLGVRVTPQHQQFQQRLLELRSRGLLLTLCSKNNEQDVWDVFDQHPEMLLRRADITAAAINWSTKSSNLYQLAERLQLGLDSFIFLDDSPLECAEVQANYPQVLSLQLPATGELIDFVDHVWVFDNFRITNEDQQRAERYQQEQSRQADRRTASSLREFLQSLNLEVKFLEVAQDLRPRMAQLMQRTNQFNCTLQRYSERELGDYFSQPQHGAFAVEVSDKFGRYGVVGGCLYEINQACLVVDSLLLSCRALGRGVERYLLRHIGRLASEQGCKEVRVDLVHGPRNAPAREFLESLGRDYASPTANGTSFVFPVARLIELDPLDVPESVSPRYKCFVGIEQPFSASPQCLDCQDCHRASDCRADYMRDCQPGAAATRVTGALCFAGFKAGAGCGGYLRGRAACAACGMLDAFQDLGGGSLQIVLIHSRLSQELSVELTITELYALPTIRAIVDRIAQLTAHTRPATMASQRSSREADSNSIAVIGMADVSRALAM